MQPNDNYSDESFHGTSVPLAVISGVSRLHFKSTNHKGGAQVANSEA